MSEELNNLRTTARRLSNGLSQSVKALGEAGIRYLLAAHVDKFTDTSQLQKAYEALTKALQRDRQNAQYYVALGYLCILVGDYQTAHRFYDTLLKLKPGHPDGLIFMDYLRFRAPELFPALGQKKEEASFILPPKKLSSTAKTAPPDESTAHKNRARLAQDPEQRKEGAENEFDALYDKVEKRILQRLQTHMRLQLPELTLESNEIKILETHEERLALTILELNQELDTLEKDMDVSGLRQRMRPLEQHLERLRDTLERSRHFRKVRSQISKLTRETVESHAQVDKKALALAAAEMLLESLLDRCDALADQLEELEMQGFSIKVLEKPYHRLVTLLEGLQEKLDGF